MKLFLLLTTSCIALFSFGQLQANELNKGYKGSFEVGFAAGAGEAGHNRGEFIIINGYQLNKYLSVGIGTGIQAWQVTQ